MKYRPPVRNNQMRNKISKFSKRKQFPEDNTQWVSNRPQNQKKTFNITSENFPSLGTNTEANTNRIIDPGMNMCYKDKIKTLFKKKRKKHKMIEPGMIRWVYNNKTGEWIQTKGCMKELEEMKEIEEYYKIMNAINGLILKWQTYRDEQNELLLDRSPFWNEPSLFDWEFDENDENDEDEFILMNEYI